MGIEIGYRIDSKTGIAIGIGVGIGIETRRWPRGAGERGWG